ncbi:MAG: glycerol-3-phosphate 1-O-acyltransferase PlsY [Clostridia bacterium]|nr:glycerol-3-phosphate 1-O-acyltransferase PlsY [Clostridia bacterium]
MPLNISIADLSPVAVPGLICLLVSYLLGSLNFSIILSKFRNDDVRKHGSGNAGMTNTLRTYGKWAAVLVFVMDFIKCAVAILITRAVIANVVEANALSSSVVTVSGYLAGYICMLGHMFPVYFGFRGGKGVVTSTALILFIDWRCFLVVFAVFAILFIWKKIISLGSVIGAFVYPIANFIITYLFDYTGSPLANHGDKSMLYLIAVTVISALIGGTVMFMHRANIGRLLAGTEKPIVKKK